MAEAGIRHPAKWFAMEVASLRAVALPNTRAGALWYLPVSVGLRLR
jgi:hypothetical protein